MTRSEFQTSSLHGDYRERQRSNFVSSGTGYVYYSPLNPGDGKATFWYPRYSGTWEAIIDRHRSKAAFKQLRKWRRTLPVTDRLARLDTGGPLWKELITLSEPTLDVSGVTKRYPDGRYTQLSGKLYPGSSASAAARDFPTIASSRLASAGFSLAEMIAMGTEGINRSLPDLPPFDLPQYFGELREGLPRIPGSSLLDYRRLNEMLVRRGLPKTLDDATDLVTSLKRKFRMSNVASEYLNLMFGVAPTAQMGHDLIELSLHPELLALGSRDLLRTIRRRRTLLDDETTSLSTTRETAYTSALSAIGYTSQRVTTTRRVWVVSCFDYLPALMALRSATGPLRGYLLNALRADTLWELSPYSWLADYFANVGTVLQNSNHMQRQGLGLQYSYCMAETTVRTTWTWSGSVNGSGATTSMEEVARVQQRIKASPFGFGYKSNLSPNQIAILAALGISRMGGRVRPT